jgi:hypothetical protein
MTTILSNTCPQCGALIPEDSAHGLCPRCVFAKALAPTADGGFISYVPPSLEAVRAAFPHLEVTALIGSGGMGAVFKARQPQLDRFVALKILPADLAGQPGFSERFQREAQALARLSHPHIVTVHDFGRTGDFCFLLMEFIDGVNLRQLLQTKRLTPKEALSIVPPICEALQCAHDHGIVHRDIKPENLLIDKAGTVKIADFGIAKIMGGGDADAGAGESGGGKHPASSMPFGTPEYAAPEQAGGSADHRADIYSLGVVLYEMLTGERPAARLEAPSKRVQVDIRIDEIVLRALEKSPELRFATAAEFRTCVEAVQITSRQTVPERAAPSSRPWLLPVAVLLLLASGGVIMGLGAYAASNWGWGSDNAAMIAGAVLPLIAGIISGWRLFREPMGVPLGPVSRAVLAVVASLGLYTLIRLPGSLWVPAFKETLGQSSLVTFLAVYASFAQVVWVLQAGGIFGLYIWTQRRRLGAPTKTPARMTACCFALLFLHSVAPWAVVASAKLAASPASQAAGSRGTDKENGGASAQPVPPVTPQESRIDLKYMDAAHALDWIKKEHPELAGGVRHAETKGNSMVLDAGSSSFEPLRKYLEEIDQPQEVILLSGTMTETLPDAPPGSGRVISKPTVTMLLGNLASFRTTAKDGLQIEFSIKVDMLAKTSADAAGLPRFSGAGEEEKFVLAGTVAESARGASAEARKVFLLPTLEVPPGRVVTFTHRLQDGRDVGVSIKVSRQSSPPPTRLPDTARPPAAKTPANKPPEEIPFKGEPKLRYIAWMPKDEDGWQFRTPAGEAVTAPGDIPAKDWEWWKGGLLDNGTAAKINGTSGWLMFFYSHPAIDQRSESRLSLFTAEGVEIKLNQQISGHREPRAPQADGWLATGCRVPYAAVKAPLKVRLALTGGAWWSSDVVAAGRTNNSGGGQFLTNSGEDANHQAFVTVLTQDEDKFPYDQWEVLGRLHDGSDVRCQGSTAVNVQDQYVHTVSFAQPLSSFTGFIMRSRERKKFTHEGVHIPPLLIAAAEPAATTLQLRWVHEAPSAETEPMMLAGSGPSETLNVAKTILLDQSVLNLVKPIHRPGCEQIALQFTESGRQRFAQITREGNGRRLAVVIGGRVRAAPMISAEISEEVVEIDCHWTYEEGDDLTARLASALPGGNAPDDESSEKARKVSRSRLPAPRVEIIQLETTAEEIARVLPATPKRRAIQAEEKSAAAIKSGRALLTGEVSRDDAQILLAACKDSTRFNGVRSAGPLSNITVRDSVDSYIHLAYTFNGVSAKVDMREHQAAIIVVPDASSAAQVRFYMLRLE